MTETIAYGLSIEPNDKEKFVRQEEKLRQQGSRKLSTRRRLIVGRGMVDGDASKTLSMANLTKNLWPIFFSMQWTPML